MIGCNGGFDKCVTNYLYELKNDKYHQIKICLVLDYLDRKFDEYDKRMIKKYFDDIIYPPIENRMKKFAIVYRNKWMIDNSDYVIFFVHKSWGGAKLAMDYAKKQNKNYINLAYSTNSRV